MCNNLARPSEAARLSRWRCDCGHLRKTKIIFVGIIIFAAFFAVHGQGTIGTPAILTAYLNGACEVPANESQYEGSANLSYNLLTYNPLSNTVVNCTVFLPYPFFPTGAGIYGPANLAQTAPLLFDLGQYQIVTNVIVIISWPPVPDPPSITNVFVAYTNTLSVTPQQMRDLNAGLCYVNVTSLDYPAGEIRGQINAGTVVTQPRFQDGGGFMFEVTAPPSQNYEIDVSTDLVNWSAVTNVNTTNNLFQFVDSDATNSAQRFYRVESQ